MGLAQGLCSGLSCPAMDQNELQELLAKTINIECVYLSSGIVIRVGDPWPGPDGNPAPPLSVPSTDGGTEQVALKVAAIFEFPEERETASTDEGEFTVIRPAHYEIWPHVITSPVKFISIPKSRENWSERVAPTAYAGERSAQYLTDNVAIPDDDEGDEDGGEPQQPAIIDTTSQPAP